MGDMGGFRRPRRSTPRLRHASAAAAPRRVRPRGRTRGPALRAGRRRSTIGPSRGGAPVNEAEGARLRDSLTEMPRRRGLDAAALPTLLKLLETPRARTRYPPLSPDEVRAVAESFVRPARRS